MKAKGTQKEKGKEKKMVEQEALDAAKIRRFQKMMSRSTGYPRYELNIFEIVYCHVLDKFVDHDACDGCRGSRGNYRSSWGQRMCSKADHDPPHMLGRKGWTIGELMIELEKERQRVLKEKEEEMKDREEFGPIHVDTPEEIREREEFARQLSRVDPLDMLKPFTI